MKISLPLIVSFAFERRCDLGCTHCSSRSIETHHPDALTTAEVKLVSVQSRTLAR